MGFILLGLYQLRNSVGKAPFYVALGVFKYLHYFLSRTTGLEILHGVDISIGSNVLLSGILFTILLVYMVENAIEARKVLLAMITAHLIFGVLQFTLGYLIQSNILSVKMQFAPEFFHINPRIFYTGLGVLFLDGVIIIYLFDQFSRIKKYLFFRILFTMSSLMLINIFVFALAAGIGTPRFYKMLSAGALAKVFPLIAYSILFWAYLRLVIKEIPTLHARRSFQDTLFFFAFQPQYAALFDEKKMAIKAKEESENKFEITFNASLDAISISWLSDG